MLGVQYDIMNRCEHGQRITKFCITEHCHHKEAAGCDYCIRKYHFHLTNTVLLNQSEVEDLLKKVVLPSDTKYKTRSLQEASLQYLRQLRSTFNTWLEQAEKSITERLAHPLLRTQGLLSTYSRLKYKQYRKLNSKDLRAFNDFTKNNTPEYIKRQEIQGYYREVEWTKEVFSSIQKVTSEMVKLPETKEGEGTFTCPSMTKLNQLFEAIKRQSQIRQKSNKGSFGSSAQRSETYKLEDSISWKKKIIGEQRQSVSISATKSVEKRIVREGSISQQYKRNTLTNESESPDAVTNIVTQPQQAIKQVKVERQMKLKRRRSSIDDKLDFKFGQTIDEKAKEYEQRKKKLLESSNERKTIDIQKKEENKYEDFLSKKIGRKEEEKNKHRESMENSGNMNDSDPDNKLKEGFNYIQTAFENILPPLTPPKNIITDEIIPKVIKIPVVVKDITDQIQSPILKSRKKQTSSNSPSPFGINLQSASGSKEGSKDEVNEKQVQVIPFQKTPVKEEDEPIILEHKQKNSLLLFSEALRSNTDKAIQLLKASLKYSPNNLSAAEYLSYLYLENGKAKECLQVCQSILISIEDTPQEFELTLHLHNNRAAALNMLGRYSESIMILEKCLRTRRKHYFYKNLADAYFSLGIPQKAAMNYQKALKLDPQYDEAFYNLAVSQFIQEEYTSALLNIRQARRIDHDNQNYQDLQREITKRIESIAI